MFARIKRAKTTRGFREYIQIVENWREGKRVHQRVIGTIGRVDEIIPSGKLDDLIESLSRFSEKLSVVRAARDGSCICEGTWEWGPALVFRRLWERIGFPGIFNGFLSQRRYRFDMERAIFVCVLQRLLEPGSDLSCTRLIERVYDEGIRSLSLQHLYRAMGFLDENKEKIERSLFYRTRDLFDAEVDLVFFDTTSTYFEGDGPEGFSEYGYSKDKRPDRKQIIIGVVMSRRGWPLACEFWPGNTSDARTLSRIIRLVRKRFSLGRVILVCDRGVTSDENLKSLDDASMDYIVGVRMRRLKEVSEEVLSKGGRYREVSDNLKVKEIKVKGRRYIICLNPEEEKRERLSREAIVDQIKEKLQTGGIKKFIANRGYRSLLSVEGETISIDWKKVEEDSRYDGKFVLRTNTDLSASEVAVTYKALWQVERAFRNIKSVFRVRPIFHRREDMVKGHVFANFLALYLMVSLQKECEAKGIEFPWEDGIGDLREVRAVELNLQGKRYLFRTELKGYAHDLFRASGVRPPLSVQKLV